MTVVMMTDRGGISQLGRVNSFEFYVVVLLLCSMVYLPGTSSSALVNNMVSYCSSSFVHTRWSISLAFLPSQPQTPTYINPSVAFSPITKCLIDNKVEVFENLIANLPTRTTNFMFYPNNFLLRWYNPFYFSQTTCNFLWK